MAKLNKKKTGNKIIDFCKNSRSLSIDVNGFWKKFKSVAYFKEACKFCGIEPVYDN